MILTQCDTLEIYLSKTQKPTITYNVCKMQWKIMQNVMLDFVLRYLGNSSFHVCVQRIMGIIKVLCNLLVGEK